MTNKKEQELKPGLTELDMKEHTSMERNMDAGNLTGLTVLPMMVSLSTTTSMARVNIYGVMVETTMVNGRTTKCTEMAYFPGLTDAAMMAHI